ncbi:hypothetical protein ACHAXN_007151 [Cyclotella atomus]
MKLRGIGMNDKKRGADTFIAMGLRRAVALALSLTAATITQPSCAFVPGALTVLKTYRPGSTLFFATDEADCGCGNSAKISGAPSQQARAINPREAILKSSVLRLDGSRVAMSELLPNSNGVSLEQILQYAKRRSELLANNIQFVLVSIGKPEIGLELCKHLGVESGPDFIFADPENEVYDKLALNRGWDTMIRPATAFRFKDRIFGSGQSLDSLFEVLGKWKDAVYIPPKLEQSTNHGGTFIFNGENVVFVHYDESPGTHADTEETVALALKIANDAKLSSA